MVTADDERGRMVVCHLDDGDSGGKRVSPFSLSLILLSLTDPFSLSYYYLQFIHTSTYSIDLS